MRIIENKLYIFRISFSLNNIIKIFVTLRFFLLRETQYINNYPRKTLFKNALKRHRIIDISRWRLETRLRRCRSFDYTHIVLLGETTGFSFLFFSTADSCHVPLRKILPTKTSVTFNPKTASHKKRGNFTTS